jgi:hypothetical protein
VVRARDWPVRRNHIDIEFVNVVELGRFGFGRAGHAGQPLIEAEIILDRDRRQRLRFTVDLDAFLRFDRLMQPVAPARPVLFGRCSSTITTLPPRRIFEHPSKRHKRATTGKCYGSVRRWSSRALAGFSLQPSAHRTGRSIVDLGKLK